MLYLRNVIILFLLAPFMFSCGGNDNYTAYFSGEVANPRMPYVLFSRGNKVIDTLKLDKNNRFHIKFDSLTPGLYSFKHDPDYQYVYFDKNDSLTVFVNSADFDKSVVFGGRGERRNNFMMELFALTETDRHNSYDIYGQDFKTFEKFIDSTFALRKAFYEKSKKAINWDDDFDFYAKNRLYLSYYSKKEYYPYIHARRTGNDIRKTLPKDYYSYRKEIDFNDKRFGGFSPFIRYTTGMLSNIAITRNYKNGSVEENPLDNNLTRLQVADSIFKNAAVKNEVLNNIAFNYLLEDQNIANNQKFLQLYSKLSTDKDKDNEINKISASIKKLDPKELIPPVALIDAAGKKFDIQKNLSRETVVFFWTSCAMVYFDNVNNKVNELKKEFPDIDFIAVNVDTDAEWKKNISSFNFKAAAAQLHASDFNDIKNKWVVTKISRTLILNPDSTIKNAFSSLIDPKFKEKL